MSPTAQEQQFLGILGVPRSGSNLLLDILCSAQQVQNLAEVFHHFTPVEELRDQIFNRFISYQEYVDHVQRAPCDCLRMFADPTKTVTLFKVFPNHLTEEAFRSVVQCTSGFVVLYRNLLSSYSSDVIATGLNSYYNVRTDGISATWDIKHFVDWAVHIVEFMRTRLEALLAAKVPVIHLTYSEIELAQHWPEMLWQKIQEPLQASLQIGEIPAAYKPRLIKQDSRSPLARFDDGEAVRNELLAHGLGNLLNGMDIYDYWALERQLKAIQEERGYFLSPT